MTTLLLVENDSPAGTAIRDVIRSVEDFDLAWDAHGIPELSRFVDEASPDVILLSHGLLQSRLLEVTRILAGRSWTARILVLSTHNDSRFVLRAFEAGASGYLLQDRAFEELETAVNTVMAGRNYLSPGIAGMAHEIVGEYSPVGTASTNVEGRAT